MLLKYCKQLEVFIALDVLMLNFDKFRTVLKFLPPTNAPLYYTYKMLKCTVKLSHDCSYMFRSTCDSQTARHTIHTTAWNTFYHNIAEHI